jgi:hypothetical protein
MGSVFEADDTTLQRSVALKLISATYAQDPEYRERLQREARIAGRLRNPHVVPIHGAGEIDGQLYVDMRLIDGVDLDTTLARSARLSPPRAVAIVSQIASALDDAHAAGVLHRDVKPANILLTENDFAYLVDFGIANAAAESKLTQAGDVVGTWAYMAPERLGGDPATVTGSADVYALACVLFETLTGSPPFQGDSISVAGAHVTQPPPRPSAQGGIPAALDEVIARGMAKDPRHRYATAGALARAAEAAIRSGATSMQRPPPMHGPTAQLRLGPPGPSQQPGTTWNPTGAGPAFPTGPQPHHWAPPVAPQPRRQRKRWPLVVAATVLVVALVVGGVIWKATSGPSKRTTASGVDLSSLDVGKYSTQPRTLPATATEDEGRFLAAFRLGESVLIPYDFDPIITSNVGFGAPDPKTAATAISATLTPVVQPVLEQYRMSTGFVMNGTSPRSDEVRHSLTMLITSYPNQDLASQAAAAMDDVDFAENPNNQHQTIPGYPQAHAHYDPADSSMAATINSGYFAISINYAEAGIRKHDGYFDELARKVKNILDLQMPLMSSVTPILEIAFTHQVPDPDGMLRRAFVAGAQPAISNSYRTLGPRAVVTCESRAVLEAGVFEKAGVDRCADTPDGSLLRTRDDGAASSLLDDFIRANRPTAIDHDITSPVGLVNETRCYEQKQSFWKDRPNLRFVCFVAFGRYVAYVGSNDESDVRQRAAAQYAILVNSA